MKQNPTTIRLKPEARRMQGALAKKLGLSLTAVIELAIRKLAQKEKIS